MGISLAKGVSAALSMVAVNLEQPSEFGAHQHLLDILHILDEIQYRGVSASPDKSIYYNYRYCELSRSPIWREVDDRRRQARGKQNVSDEVAGYELAWKTVRTNNREQLLHRFPQFRIAKRRQLSPGDTVGDRPRVGSAIQKRGAANSFQGPNETRCQRQLACANDRVSYPGHLPAIPAHTNRPQPILQRPREPDSGLETVPNAKRSRRSRPTQSPHCIHGCSQTPQFA